MTAPAIRTESTGVRVLSFAVIAYVGCAGLIYPGTFVAIVVGYSRLLQAMLFLGIMLLFLKAMAHRPYSSLRAREVIRGDWHRPLLVVGISCVGLSAYTTLKLSIPSHVPFYLDHVLADADLWLHGENPGDILHRLIPERAAGMIQVLYTPVWFLLLTVIPLWAGLMADDGLRRRYFRSLIACFVLVGTVLAMALSSVGPIFYERIYGDDRFAGLVSKVYAGPAGGQMKAVSDYLYASLAQQETLIGTGISSMPSVHVVVVTLNAWFLTQVGRWIGGLAWAYVSVVLVGSVYLGWHYALDGYVSILAASLIWRWCAEGGEAPARPADPAEATSGVAAG